jgi:uncharacterized membrane-anchored protein YitT (DUF2179 family)
MQNIGADKIVKYAKIAVGSALYAAGFQFLVYPNAMITGGVTGIAMIINYLTQLPVGILSIIMNIPLFVVSWKRFGLGFMVSSFLGMLLCSVFIDLLSMIDFVITTDLLLASVFGGVVKGLGLGIVYSTSATTGGIDIVAKFLRAKYQYINFSTFILALDIAIIAIFAVIFDKYESALYSVICMYVCAKAIDVVLLGAVNSKVCYIITDESIAIKNAITEKLGRGVTFLHGEGAWSGKEKNVILCVIKTRQIVELKHLVRELDERAFMIVSDSREVFGKGFTYIGDEG